MATANARYISMNVHQRHVDKLDAWAEMCGMNRNQFLKTMIDQAEDSDIAEIVLNRPSR